MLHSSLKLILQNRILLRLNLIAFPDTTFLPTISTDQKFCGLVNIDVRIWPCQSWRQSKANNLLILVLFFSNSMSFSGCRRFRNSFPWLSISYHVFIKKYGGVVTRYLHHCFEIFRIAFYSKYSLNMYPKIHSR